jgi:hypothetical protein
MATKQEIQQAEKSMSSTLLEVIGPGLIMLMVGSLVFFLIEVLYRGPHTGRLCFVFGLFTFASVLVSRVSIQSGIERGKMFGLALGMAAFVTSYTLVEFEGVLATVMEPILLLVFICVVMWSASKLTWDCTVIDKSRDTSATGITELVRRNFRGTDEKKSSDPVSDDSDSATEVGESSDAQAGNLIKAFFTRGQRKNTPGVWVFYFAMAALPIFGFGQWFVIPDPKSGYFWVVLLFGVYLAAALSLMMTTSLLGLQRYLRKRKTHMPPEIARNWLSLGFVASLIVLVAVLLFPRPDAKSSIADGLKWFTSPPIESSDQAFGKDGTEEKNYGNSQKSSEEGQQSSGNAKTNKTSGSSQNGEKTQGGGKGKGNQSSSSSSKSQQSKDGQQSQQQKSGQSQGNQNGDKQKGGGDQKKNGDQSQGNSQNGEKQKQDSGSEKDGGESKGEEGETRKSKVPDHMRPDKSAENKRRKEAEAAAKNQERKNSENQSEQRNSSNSSSSSKSNPKNSSQSNGPKTPNAPSMQAFTQIATFITYLIVGIAALVLIVMFRKEILAAIRGFIDELKKMFGKRPDETASAEEAVGLAPTPVRQIKSFRSYANPFESGRSESMPPEKVVEYTFLALEAWAFERGLERPKDQTPHEFAAMLKKLDPQVGKASVGLCNLFCKNLFGGKKMGPDELLPLKELWQLMQNATSPTQTAFAG